MSKGSKSVMLLTTVVLLVVLLVGCGGTDKLTVNQVNIVADLLPDGDLYVEELFTYTVSGEYDSISRFMDNFGDANIEFFEAYVPPVDRELGNFGYQSLERYPVTLRWRRGSYFIDVQAKDESRQVYYRYRLDKEAVKYDDRGELDWSLLKDNDKEHQNVSVTLRIRQPVQEPVIVYAYDRSGGAVTETSERVSRYENKLLPKGDHVRMKVFVPLEALPELETTSSSSLLSERLEQESALQRRFVERDRLLEAGVYVSRWLTYAAIAGVVFYALSIRRLAAWWDGRRITMEEIEHMNPSSLVYLFRKGKLRRENVLASVFALRRKGMLDISMEHLGTRFQQDDSAPKEGPQFRFAGNRSGLTKSERYLLSWLFRGTEFLKLDSISGPTKSERHQKSSMHIYKNRLKGLETGFNRWREIVEQENRQTIKYGVYRPRKIIFAVLALVHVTLLTYLYIADVISWGWIGVMILILGGGAALASIRWRQKKYIIAFLIVCFFMGAQIMYDPVVDTYLDFVLLSILLVGLMPGVVLDRRSEACRSAVKRYRRMLARGGRSEDREPIHLERMMEAALLLGVGRRFLTRIRKKQPDYVRPHASPLFDPASHVALDFAFQRSWKGLAGNSSSWSSSGGDGGDGDSGGGFFGDSNDSGSDGGDGGGD